MALPNDKRSLQDRLSRVATRMAQKFGNGVFTGVTVGAGASAGIPASVLVNRIAGKKVSLDSLRGENASALSFTVIDTGNGITAATQDQLIASTYLSSQMPVGLYGSPTALTMLAKLKARVDSVDFHLVGDSNIGVASPGFGTEGYMLGLARGLIRGTSAGMYATALSPVGICTANSNTVSITFLRHTCRHLAVGANGQNGRTFEDGRNAPSDIKRYFNTTGLQLGYGYAGGLGSLTNFFWATGNGISYSFSDLDTNDIHEYVPNGSGDRGWLWRRDGKTMCSSTCTFCFTCRWSRSNLA